MALIHYNFDSRVLVQKTDVLVILPDVDWGEETEGKKYQTLYLLHGGGEDYTSYVRYTNIETWANERKLAVIMPCGTNSSYMDMAYGQRYYTYISEELPNVMQHVFPLSRKKEDHFVMGFSMGGMGTSTGLLTIRNFLQQLHLCQVEEILQKQRNTTIPGIPASAKRYLLSCPLVELIR